MLAADNALFCEDQLSYANVDHGFFFPATHFELHISLVDRTYLRQHLRDVVFFVERHYGRCVYPSTADGLKI